MANSSGRKIKPFVAWVDNEESLTTDHQMQKNSSLPDGSEAHWSDDQTSKQMTLSCDEPEIRTAEGEFSTAESEFQKQRGGLRKRCHWFDDTAESFDADAANSSSANNFSISSPIRTFRRRRWKEKKSSSSAQTLKDKDCHSANCAEYSRATPPATYPGHMQVCLPPGCIPTDVIVQVPENDTQSTPQWRNVMTEDTEVDLWMQDICHQAMTLRNSFVQPVFSAPVISTLPIARDLEREVSLEIIPSTDILLRLFLENQKGVVRRNAICEELEMTTSLVKINGVKFTLWHLRAELLNTLKIRKL